MKHCQNTQFGAVIVITMVLVIFVIFISSSEPLETPRLVLYAFLSIVTFLFSTLTVKVDDKYLSWYFGPGFWKKRVALSDIEAVTPINTKWYWGWGIRLTPNGWLYNVSGLSAVKVVLKSGTTLVIGTNDSANLTKKLRNGS